jgi:hypothetical protein
LRVIITSKRLKLVSKEDPMMNQHEDIAWLRLQDLQREAENRRLMAGGRWPATLAMVRRLLARRPGGQATETRQKLA